MISAAQHPPGTKSAADDGGRPLGLRPPAAARCALLRLAAAAAALAAGPALAQNLNLADLSLEELASLEVTSVSGRAEALSGAAASIYVITREDIRRSGVTTLAEALRLAPNLLVARIDSAQYAISARGFNSAIANKLLVLVDGRTVYTPLLSGVFWEMQDVMLEDVARIEVISGPGATLWGANAVNGVINVITRRAEESQGALAVVGVGGQEAGFRVRHGGSVGRDGHFRVYAKATELDNTERADGAAVRDSWERAQAGFRADLYGERGSFTVQGDVYSGRSEHRGALGDFDFGRLEVSGFNVLSRWTRRLGGGSDLRVQAYVDHSDRDDAFAFSPEADIFDVEAQHAVPFGAGHQLLWGGGYRRGRDDVADGLLFSVRPSRRELDWANLFAQTELALTERLDLTLGLKLEHNDYTGTERLPSARIAWRPAPGHLVWSGLSRAVRAPSRLDRDFQLSFAGIVLIRGGPNFVSEVADVLEVGYRGQIGDALTLSSTIFDYEWDRLRSGQPPPAFIENRIEGGVYGVESWASWQPLERWRLSAGLTAFRKSLRLEPGSADPVGPSALGNDPEYQWLLRSSHDIGLRHEVDVLMRRVDELPEPRVPAYTAVDVRYSWEIGDRLSLGLTVQNLFDERHPESGGSADRSELPRTAYLSLTFGGP